MASISGIIQKLNEEQAKLHNEVFNKISNNVLDYLVPVLRYQEIDNLKKIIQKDDDDAI